MDSIEQAVDKLKIAIQRLEQRPARDDLNGLNGYQYCVSKKPEVVAKYGALFSPQNIASLTAEQFQDFLPFKNNHHWGGLNMFGAGKKICADMKLLRDALTILVAEDDPIEKRLNKLRPDGKPPMIPLLGRAVLTPGLCTRTTLPSAGLARLKLPCV
jgi:hypothetical protein